MELSPGELRVLLTLLYKEYHADKVSEELLRNLAANTSSSATTPKFFLSQARTLHPG